MQSRPAGSSSATPVPLTPLGNHPEQLHALAQRWQAGDRSDALRAEIDDEFELILGLLKGLRDFTMTNPAHQACIGSVDLLRLRCGRGCSHTCRAEQCRAARSAILSSRDPTSPKVRSHHGRTSSTITAPLAYPPRPPSCCLRPFMRPLFLRHPQGRAGPHVQNVRVRRVQPLLR